MENRDRWSKIEVVGKVIGSIIIPVIIIYFGYIYKSHKDQTNEYHQEFSNTIELLKLCNDENSGLRAAGFSFSGYLFKKEKLDSQMMTIITNLQSTEKNSEVAKKAGGVVEGFKKDSVAKEVIEKLDLKLSARIYFHIQNNDQREKAKNIEIGLEEETANLKKDFLVPGIELKEYNLKNSELRFFNSKEKEEANEIKKLMENSGIKITLRDLSKIYKNSKIRPRHYEVWFGNDF